MKTNNYGRNNRVMLKRKIAESRRTFGAGRRLLLSLPDFAPRLVRILLVVAAGGGAAYFLQRQVLAWLFQPAGTQAFAYTSYGQLGLMVTLYVCAGLLLAIPVAMYHILRALETRFVRVTTAYFVGLGAMSASLAAAGLYVGYYYGLPQALQFISRVFLPDPAQPLAAIEAYVQFAALYILMTALAFQIPLVMYLLNQLKVRRVATYLRRERSVLLGSLLIGAAINPSDDVLAMFVVALPVALLYQAGVLVVWCVNRFNRAEAAVAMELLHTDAAMQAERLQQLEAALRMPVLEPVPVAMPDSGQEEPSLPPPAAPSQVVPTPNVVPGRPETPSTVNGIRRRLY